MKSFIVLFEINDSDELLLEQAIRLASAFDSRLYLIHVAAPEPGFVGYEAGPQHERNWRSKTLHEAHRILQQQSDQLREQGMDSEALLIHGATADTILAEAKRLHADLLILGNHHKGVFQRMVSGSTGDEMVHHADCPILLVPVQS